MNGRAERDRRREEAEARNSKWAALTPQQQLAHLDKLGHVAKKQRSKIEKKMK